MFFFNVKFYYEQNSDRNIQATSKLRNKETLRIKSLIRNQQQMKMIAITPLSASISLNCVMRISSGMIALSRAAFNSASMADSLPASISLPESPVEDALAVDAPPAATEEDDDAATTPVTITGEESLSATAASVLRSEKKMKRNN